MSKSSSCAEVWVLFVSELIISKLKRSVMIISKIITILTITMHEMILAHLIGMHNPIWFVLVGRHIWSKRNHKKRTFNIHLLENEILEILFQMRNEKNLSLSLVTPCWRDGILLGWSVRLFATLNRNYLAEASAFFAASVGVVMTLLAAL